MWAPAPKEPAGPTTPEGSQAPEGTGSPAVTGWPTGPAETGWPTGNESTAGAGTPPPGDVLGTPGSPAASAEEPPAGHRGRKVAIEWAVILAVAILAAFLIRSFAIEPFYIPSGSMMPTLQVGDRVLVNKLSYDAHSVHRGDIVVFKKPANDYSPGVKDLIKRVVGLPGETISAHGGSVYIDGRRLAEPWLPRGETTSAFPSVFIPRGDYFMMGDNRGDSADSRIIGPVTDKLFVGRAFIRVWPVSRIGGL